MHLRTEVMKSIFTISQSISVYIPAVGDGALPLFLHDLAHLHSKGS